VAATVWFPESGGTGVWTFDINGRESRQLTFPPEVGRRPVWSPDGERLAVGTSPIVGSPKLGIVDLATGKTEEFVDPSKTQPHALPTDWSADGRFIVFEDGLGEEVREVWIADVASHNLVPLLRTKFPQWGTAFSPDGGQLAFVSMESGRPEVYLQAFDSSPSPHVVGERRQVSRNGAWLARWDGKGKEVFYVGLDNNLYAAKVTGRVAFREPQRLFPIPGVSQFGTTRDFQFDVSPDGQRFIMPTTGSVAPPPFTVIENWQDKFHR
jgi:Tol biopolymer transport system component